MPKVPILSVMLAPMLAEEVLFYKAMASQVFPLEDFVTDLMRRKLLRRTHRQKNILSLKDLEQIELRALLRLSRAQGSKHFDYVLVNHEGGDNEYWSSFYYPVGDPLKVLNAFADLLHGKPTPWAEKWEKGPRALESGPGGSPCKTVPSAAPR